MSPAARKSFAILLSIGVLATAAGAILRLRQVSTPVEAQSLHPLLMGTQCNLTAVPAKGQSPTDVSGALSAGHEAMVRVDEALSLFKPGSDLSRVNAAAAGEAVEVGDLAERLLALARQYSQDSDGAFDPTARALFRLWKSAGKANRLPTPEELDGARAHQGWDKLRIEAGTVTRLDAQVQLDLNAIAAGYAADLAAQAMRQAGAAGGLADAGGEIRVFGRPAKGETWRIAIQNPFRPAGAFCGIIALRDGAVSTSGNYQQYETIEGQRHSHIVDPRTGSTVDAVPSVTVVAPDAVSADMWSTALSVLGPDGLKRIENAPGIEAMMILGTPEAPEVLMTSGFQALLVDGRIDLE